MNIFIYFYYFYKYVYRVKRHDRESRKPWGALQMLIVELFFFYV